MARLWTSGFELNSLTANVEITAVSGTNSISTTTVRSGTYAFRTNPTAGTSNCTYDYRAAATQENVYYRVYVYITTTVDATNLILSLRDGGVTKLGIRLLADRTLELYNNEDAARVGSLSSALNTGQWYRLELNCNTTTLASTTVDARIDGTSFSSGTVNLTAGISQLRLGPNTANTTCNLFFDDVAINDGTGSFQNSWPGAGEIIHLRPNAAGDNTAWNEGVGSTYAEVDEVTPDDGSTFIGDNDANVISDFNIDATPAALASDDTINCVHVGVRYQVVVTGAPAEFVLRIKAAASGTVEESAAIVPNSTSWGTNANAAPRNYPLTLYDLPGASTTAWTKADLDTTQIGVRVSTANTWRAQVSTLWLLVDHTPATVTSSVKDILGSGIIPFARS